MKVRASFARNAGQHEVRALVVEREQLLLVGREPEEPVALLDPLGHDVVLGALAVDELLLRLERLAADAVEPRVDVLVDVVAAVVRIRCRNSWTNRLWPSSLVRMKKSFATPRRAGSARHASAIRSTYSWGASPCSLGDARHLRRVLVDPGEQERLTAALPLMTREHVGRDRRVGVADVRRRVDVVDRRRQVVRLHPDRFYGRPSHDPCRDRAPSRRERREELGASPRRYSSATRRRTPGRPRCRRAAERQRRRRGRTTSLEPRTGPRVRRASAPAGARSPRTTVADGAAPAPRSRRRSGARRPPAARRPLPGRLGVAAARRPRRRPVACGVARPRARAVRRPARAVEAARRRAGRRRGDRRRRWSRPNGDAGRDVARRHAVGAPLTRAAGDRCGPAVRRGGATVGAGDGAMTAGQTVARGWRSRRRCGAVAPAVVAPGGGAAPAAVTAVRRRRRGAPEPAPGAAGGGAGARGPCGSRPTGST